MHATAKPVFYKEKDDPYTLLFKYQSQKSNTEMSRDEIKSQQMSRDEKMFFIITNIGIKHTHTHIHSYSDEILMHEKILFSFRKQIYSQKYIYFFMSLQKKNIH